MNSCFIGTLGLKCKFIQSSLRIINALNISLVDSLMRLNGFNEEFQYLIVYKLDMK